MLNGDNERELKKESTIDALKKHIRFYYSFKGRLNRKNFILLILESLCIIAFFFLLFMASSLFVKKEQVFVTTILIATFIVVGGIVVGLASTGIGVRRLHDLNLSGWWILLPFPFEILVKLQDRGIQLLPPAVDLIVTIVDFIIVIGLTVLLWFIKGTKGENKYGPDLLQEK